MSWDDRRRSWFCRTQSGKPWCDGRDVQSLPSHSHCGVASCWPVRVIKTIQARPISRSPQSLGSRCRRLGSGASDSSRTDLRGSMMKLVLERHARSPMSRSRRWFSKPSGRYRRMRPTGARERWPRRLDSRNRRLFGSDTRSPCNPIGPIHSNCRQIHYSLKKSGISWGSISTHPTGRLSSQSTRRVRSRLSTAHNRASLLESATPKSTHMITFATGPRVYSAP